MKDHTLLLYVLISVYFMDTMFQYATVRSFEFMGTLLSFVLLITYVLGIYLISSFFKGTVQYIITNLLLAIVAFIFASQVVYYRFFKTYYSMYSVGNTEQAFDFWRDILTYVGQNAHWIILLFLPVLVLLTFGKNYFTFKQTTWPLKFVLIGSMLVVQLIGIGVIHVGNKDQHSAYDLYYHHNYPKLATQKLGLITTMRLDLQRLLTNWSPTLTAPPVHDSTGPGENENDEKDTEEASDYGEDASDNASNADEEAVEEPEYNVLDIDFDSLIEEENNNTIKEMHEYFSSVEPTQKNDHTGKYEGYNLILLTAESFSPIAVDEDVTPTLYKMIHEGYQFENFYTPIWEVSTSDGEYVALNSLLPKSGVWSFQKSAENEVGS